MALAIVFTASVVPVAACNLCIGYPERSAADVLLQSAGAALAREDPDRPFSLKVIEVLKGDQGDSEIDLFLDSVTRRILAGDPGSVVVIVQAEEGGPWRRLALANSDYQALVRRILHFAPQWQAAGGRLQRAEFFLPLFGHHDPTIYELAYLEIAQAPYDVIKRLSRIVEREQLERIMNRPEYLRWRSLAILIFAHRGEADDKEFIAKSFRDAERFRLTTNLAAWAAASIEIEGVQAISFIEDRYFGVPDRGAEELKEVFKALSLHGSEGRVDLRDQIVAAYGILLDFHPEMSADVAADLLAWNRSEWTDLLAQIDSNRVKSDDAGAQVIREYVRRVAANQSNNSSDD